MTPDRTIDTEVAIVGGGVAGCATALYLAQRHIPVVVLEKGMTVWSGLPGDLNEDIRNRYLGV